MMVVKLTVSAQIAALKLWTVARRMGAVILRLIVRLVEVHHVTIRAKSGGKTLMKTAKHRTTAVGMPRVRSIRTADVVRNAFIL